MDADVRSTYLFNSTLAGVDAADAILLVGTNPRVEAPVLNARIRAAATAGTPVALVGAPVDLTYDYAHLGEGAAALDALAKPAAPWARLLKEARRPAIVVGAGVLRRGDREAVMAKVAALADRVGAVVAPGGEAGPGWNGFNVLHDTAARVAALDLGFLPSARARAPGAPAPKVVFLLGADDYADADVPADAFLIYQGHHGDRGAARADVVLPGAAFTEKAATFVNTEGRVQATRVAAPPPADARDDWKVLRALSEVVGAPLPYDDAAGVRARLAEVAPHLGRRDAVEAPLWLNGEVAKATAERTKRGGGAGEAPLATAVEQFYQTDAISRASKTMARCVKARQQQAQ
jgi:NADH dehydrogenase (ubiquinone) Fe-S protein 1